MNVVINQDSLEQVRVAGGEAVEMADAVSSLIVADDAHFATAGVCLGEVKGRYKELETQRKAITKPLLDAKKGIDALFKPALTSLKDAEGSIKSGMAQYQMKLQREQQAAAAAAAKAAEEKAPVEEVKELLVQAAKTEPPKVEGVSMRMITKFEVTDASKLPRHLLVPDMPKVRNAVLSGVKVPGVRVWEEPSIAARSR